MKLPDHNRERESGRGLFADSSFEYGDKGVVLKADGNLNLKSEEIVAMFLLSLKKSAYVESGKPAECVFALPACAGKTPRRLNVEK